jgi:Na+/proline symporter
MGCAHVAWFSTRRSASGTVIIGGVLACTALQLYGRTQFPTDSTRGVGYTALFAAFMLFAAYIPLGGVRSTDTDDALARRHGTVAGAAIGVLFVVAVAPLGVGGYAVLVTVAVAARTATMCGDSGAGVRTGLWIALTGAWCSSSG